MSLLIRNARVVSGAPGVAPLPSADVLIERGRIESVTPGSQRAQAGRAPAGGTVIDANGRVLMPAFIDAHTHACWAGDRLDEWEARLCANRGEDSSYLAMLKSGGGIMATVRAVRAASRQQLADNLRARLAIMLREGATTIEVKSGYGLSTRDELKMLRAIADAASDFPGAVVPTALLGHAVDPDQPRFFDLTIEETLSAVSREFPGVAIDAYCEEGAWPLEQCRRLFERARDLGHPIRVHADQFHALGMTRVAIELGARSVDHLEATSAKDLIALAKSKAFGVMLPASGFHLDDRYANGRAFLDAGGALVLASNCNPGSAPTSSMPFVIALAARRLGLSALEAIAACTFQAAALLGLADRGEVLPGKRADLVVLRYADERRLAHEFGGDPVDMTICNGAIQRRA